MLWTNNDAKDRAKRLAAKLGGSPVVPTFAWTKVLEAAVTDSRLALWLPVAILASVSYVVAEDFLEYVEGLGKTLQEHFNDS
jgi:uncharacterized protein (DUF983 family)